MAEIFPLILMVLGSVAICLILGVIAFFRSISWTREFQSLQNDLKELHARLNKTEARLRQYEPGERSGEKLPIAEDVATMAKERSPVEKAPTPPSVPPTPQPTSADAEAPVTTPATPASPLYAVKLPGPISAPSVPAEHAYRPRSSSAPALSQSFEQLIGKRWMTWAGAAILFFSAAFFLKYAFQNNLIGPTGQVILCALVGTAMLLTGTRFIRKDMSALGQGMLGLGLAILYVTFAAAASSIYTPPVLTPPLAFLLLVTVTVAGMSLAVLHNASVIALLAVLGGFATPLLVSTGQNARDALFAYLLLLNLGILGVAFFRQWRVVDAVAMIGTYILFGGWYEKFYNEQQIAPTLAWLTAFYAVFLGLPFVFHLLRKTAVTLERFLLALGNAIFVFAFFWALLHANHQQTLGFIAIGLALIYFLMGTAFRHRLPSDGKTLFGSVALAVTFLTMAFPLHLHAHGITLAWAVEGPVLLYLGFRFRYFPIRIFSAIVLALAVFRLFTDHWPLHSGLYDPFLNRRFLSAALLPAAMAVYGWLHHKHAAEANLVDRCLKLTATLGGGFLGLILVHAETFGWLENRTGVYTSTSIVPAIWTAGSLIYLYAGRRVTSSVTWATGIFVLFIAHVFGLITLGNPWPDGGLPILNARFAALFFFCTALCLHAHVFGVAAAAKNATSVMKPLFWGMGILAFLVIFSFEIPSYLTHGLHYRDEAAQIAMTLTWGLYATALLAIGFWKRVRAVRFCALGLFGISALKLLLLDMQQTEDLIRIVSFMAVGGLMLAASYCYHRLEKKTAGVAETTPDNLAQKSETSDASQK